MEDLESASQVWETVQQWPILLLFLAGFGLAYWVWGRKKDEPKAAAVPAGEGSAILQAISGIHAEVAAQGRATIEHIDSVKTGIEQRLADHEERDNQRFDTIFGIINGKPEARERIQRNVQVFGK